jgi:hypothetical protein
MRSSLPAATSCATSLGGEIDSERLAFSISQAAHDASVEENELRDPLMRAEATLDSNRFTVPESERIAAADPVLSEVEEALAR